MISVRPKFKALSLRLRASTGAVKMPLAQAHPFEPMPVTHEENQEVSVRLLVCFAYTGIGFLPLGTRSEEVQCTRICELSNTALLLLLEFVSI